MVVIKAYPDITSKMELLHKERKWMKKLKATLNQTAPGKLIKLGKTEYQKQYGEQYREQNSHRIKQKANEKIECECGCMISRSHISCHIKTTKHIKRMNDQWNSYFYIIEQIDSI